MSEKPVKRVSKIRAALGSTWLIPRLRAAVHGLSDRELAQAEHFERLGRRRWNTLRVIHAERQRRAGQANKMLRLKVETNL